MRVRCEQRLHSKIPYAMYWHMIAHISLVDAENFKSKYLGISKLLAYAHFESGRMFCQSKFKNNLTHMLAMA